MYEVSEKVQKKLNRLIDCQEIQQALEFAEKDNDEIINKQIELTLIPAPTGFEQKRQSDYLKCSKKRA